MTARAVVQKTSRMEPNVPMSQTKESTLLSHRNIFEISLLFIYPLKLCSLCFTLLHFKSIFVGIKPIREVIDVFSEDRRSKMKRFYIAKEGFVGGGRMEEKRRKKGKNFCRNIG